jgi:hypothetical protein
LNAGVLKVEHGKQHSNGADAKAPDPRIFLPTRKKLRAVRGGKAGEARTGVKS